MQLVFRSRVSLVITTTYLCDICAPSRNLTIIVCSGARFAKPNAGVVVENGERVRVTRELYIDNDSLYVVEKTTLTNTGSVNLTNIQFMFHIAPTPEAYQPGRQGFVNYNSVPQQGSEENPRVVVKSRGQTKGMITAIGTYDNNARGWTYDTVKFQALPSSQQRSRRPYSAQWIFDDIAENGT
jgi:hypothetical protein